MNWSFTGCDNVAESQPQDLPACRSVVLRHPAIHPWILQAGLEHDRIGESSWHHYWCRRRAVYWYQVRKILSRGLSHYLLVLREYLIIWRGFDSASYSGSSFEKVPQTFATFWCWSLPYPSRYRRSYDSEYSAPLVSHHIWPCLMQAGRVLMKGEACTRRGASMVSKNSALKLLKSRSWNCITIS